MRTSAVAGWQAPFAGFVLFLVGGCGEPAGPPEAAVDRGEALFAEHCSPCHGADARGNGPIARGLISLPADLTQISVRHNAAFPHEAVRRTIDGRAGRPGHRGPEMPRWGEFWDASDAGPDGANAKIEALVRYLESIQTPAPPGPEDAS